MALTELQSGLLQFIDENRNPTFRDINTSFSNSSEWIAKDMRGLINNGLVFGRPRSGDIYPVVKEMFNGTSRPDSFVYDACTAEYLLTDRGQDLVS